MLAAANTGTKVAIRGPDNSTEDVVSIWPGSDKGTPSVPTVLAYSKAAGSECQRSEFGYVAERAYHESPDDWVLFRDFKLSFPNGVARSEDGAVRMPVATLYGDALTHIYDPIQGFFETRTRPTFSLDAWPQARVDFVFAVPAVGDTSLAHQSLVAAAEKAGFAQHPGHTFNKSMLTEPEASALYAIRPAGLTEATIKASTRGCPVPSDPSVA